MDKSAIFKHYKNESLVYKKEMNTEVYMYKYKWLVCMTIAQYKRKKAFIKVEQTHTGSSVAEEGPKSIKYSPGTVVAPSMENCSERVLPLRSTMLSFSI